MTLRGPTGTPLPLRSPSSSSSRISGGTNSAVSASSYSLALSGRTRGIGSVSRSCPEGRSSSFGRGGSSLVIGASGDQVAVEGADALGDVVQTGTKRLEHVGSAGRPVRHEEDQKRDRTPGEEFLC